MPARKPTFLGRLSICSDDHHLRRPRGMVADHWDLGNDSHSLRRGGVHRSFFRSMMSFGSALSRVACARL